MAQIAIEIQRLPHHMGLPLPEYQSLRSAGCDLHAALPANAPREIGPGEQAQVPTGIAMAIPMGFEGQVRPRSGLAAREQITVTNAPGTIDSDYVGEIQVLLINLGPKPFTISRGDRIAQLVIAPTVQAQWIEASTLPRTDRGGGGFGSTGRRGGVATDGSVVTDPPPRCEP